MTTPSSPRAWFIADIAISATMLWLCLWRWNLTANPNAALGPWRSWAPILAIPAFVVVALVMGAVGRRVVGFLPYVLRWLFVSAGLVLLAWIAVDLVTARSQPRNGVATLGASARREVGEAMKGSIPPDRRKRLEQALAAAEASEAMGVALERAEASGVPVPTAEPAPRADGMPEASAEAIAMQEVGALLLEYGDELAAGQLPEEVVSYAKDAGLDEGRMVEQVALFLASKAIAYYFGAPYAVVFELLMALLDDGELTLGEIVRLGAACVMSITPAGDFDVELFAESFDRLGLQASGVVTVMNALEGADIDVPDELLTMAKQAAGDGERTEGNDCDDDAVGEAYEAAGCVGDEDGCRPDAAERLLQHSEQRACQRLSRVERRALMLDYVRARHPERVAEFEHE